MPTTVFSPLLHRAMQFAASAHRDQVRKMSGTPYISHPAMVAMHLQRAGYDEEVVAAGILHDVVEDTPVTLAELRRAFGSRIAELVDCVSEQKGDSAGTERPWADRKQDNYEHLLRAPPDAKAVALADKLHNLWSTYLDQQAGVLVWTRFKAPPEEWLAHAKRMIEAADGEDPRQQALAAECRAIHRKLAETVSASPPARSRRSRRPSGSPRRPARRRRSAD